MSDGEPAAVWFGLLGPVSVRVAGEPVRLGGPKERLVLATLLLARGRIVAVDRLIDVLWGEDPPDRAVATVQVHVSNLRRRLTTAGDAIATRPPGYVLTADPGAVDFLAFEELTTRARTARDRGDTAAALELFGEADQLWRGGALEDLDGSAELVRNSRASLDEQRLVAGEERVGLLLSGGNLHDALVSLDRLLEVEPLRESLWEKRMVALYRSGQQGAALTAYRRCRELLLDELGVEPTPRMRALEAAVLNQDPSLDGDPQGPTPPEAAGGFGLPATFVVQQVTGQLVLDDGTAVPLTGLFRIGRNPDCDLVLDDPGVSRMHAAIRPALGGHLISDSGSSNGTLVGGEPVEHRQLQDGDRIEIGAHLLIYQAR